MANQNFRVMDSDMHVQEPWDVFLKYIEPKYKDEVPVGSRGYLADQDLIYKGKVISGNGTQLPYQAELSQQFHDTFGRSDEFKGFEERAWGPDAQIEAMDKEGIDLAILFPTRGLFAHAIEYEDNGLAAAISRAYNNWLVEFCAHDPLRMMGSALIPAQDVEAAVHEVRRAKNELNFKSIFLRPNPVLGRNWHDPAYDPLWAECQKQGLAVGFHEGVPCALPVAMADRFTGEHEDLFLTAHAAAHQIEQMYATMSMVAGGVLERFPELQVAFLEGNCNWMPGWLWRMDDHYEARENVLKDKLPLRPSEYFKRQCYVSVEAEEELAKYAIAEGYGANLIFSTDFPHPDGRYPNAVNTFLTRDFPEEDKKKILWDNCARLYGFNLAALNLEMDRQNRKDAFPTQRQSRTLVP